MYKLPDSAAERLQEVMDKATQSHQECGCQLSLYIEGEQVLELSSGYTGPDRTGKVTPDTIFPVFSVGKGIMATAFLKVLAEGKAKLDDPVCKWWPELTGQGKENIAIWQVLCHRAGLYILPHCDDQSEMADWELMCRRLENACCRHEGKLMRYHGLTFAWLVGELSRRITGVPFKQTITDNVLAPLGLTDDVFYGLPEEEEYRAAQLDNSLDNEALWCENFISNTAIRRGFVPSGNAFATANAIAKHYSALLETGKKQLLPQEWITLATQVRRHAEDPIPPGGTWANFGLGYALCGTDPATPGKRFGHGGAAGAEGYADKTNQVALGFTKNMPLANHPDHPIRKQIAEILGLSSIIW